MSSKCAVVTVLFLAAILSSCGGTNFNSPAGGGGGTPGTSTPTNVQVTLSAAVIANSGTSTVTAVVTDANSLAVQNVSVTFSVISAATGTFSPSTAVTDASGVATSTFTAITPDTTATIRASVATSTTTISGNASIVIGTPPRIPTAVVVSLGSSTIANSTGTTTATATVSDAVGGISGETVTFTVSVPGAVTFSVAAPTDASGQTTVTVTAGAVPDTIVSITATVGSLSNSAALTIGSPPPPTPTSASISINPLSVGIQGQTTVTVTVLGAGGPAYSTAVQLTIISGAALASFTSGTSQSSTSLTTNASGIASAPVYAGTSSGPVTITATVAGLSPVQASFFITSDPASISLSVANSNLINGQSTNISATVLNVLNQPVTDGTQVNFTITSSSPPGSLSAASASTVNGIASVTFTADPTLTGGVIIQASVGTLPAVQTIIIVNASQAGSLEYVSVSPQSGVIDIGGASALLTFRVLDVNGNPRQGQTVNFTLAVFPAGTTVSPASGSTDVDGIVTTTLISGAVAGPVRIVADTTVQGTSTVLYATSAPLSVGGGVPSMRFFSVSVEKYNVPGLNCDGVTDTIQLLMADRFGNYNILQGTSVSFATAYGAINTSNVTDATGQTSSVWRSQDPRPADGIVDILVQTTGEENFTDLDADGVYTAADAFSPSDDLPEPYIDTNHNGAHDVGEIFFDWPSSVPGAVAGTYNNANGQWDGNIPIFEQVNICMTGPPSAASSGIACCDPATPNCAWPLAIQSSITIPAGGYTTCYAFGGDQNGNPLTSGTSVSMTSNKTEAAIALTSGATTYLDYACGAGPAVTGFSVSNNNGSAASVIATLSATFNWSNKCGSVAATFSYPGAVILAP